MWNAMISGCNRNRRYHESLELFDEMNKEKSPSSVTFLLALSACTKLKLLISGRRIHRQLEAAQLVPGNLVLENALICMYAECKEISSAHKLFDEMKVKDVISWTSLIKGFADSGKLNRARSLFEEMPNRDLISWTAMIDAYVKANEFKEALDLFRQMQKAGIKPDAFTIAGVLTACAHLGALEAGEWVRIYVARSKIHADLAVVNALIDMYSKCGAVEKALELFSRTKRRDQFTWTAMITGLAVNGRGEEALRLFQEMLLSGAKPDGVTYVGVLQACAHSGLVDEGKCLFFDMARAHGINLEVAHYGCMVDLLGRAGLLREALELVDSMPVKANSIVLGSLLGACRLHRDAEMAEKAAERLLQLEPRDGAAYAMLAEVYGGCGRWEEVRRVRDQIAEKGVRKTPGCSFVETEGKIHEFVAGDAAHPKCAEIYAVAEGMGRQLALGRFVSDAWETQVEDASGRQQQRMS